MVVSYNIAIILTSSQHQRKIGLYKRLYFKNATLQSDETWMQKQVFTEDLKKRNIGFGTSLIHLLFIQ